jgi:hypothetical protein
MQSIKLSKAKKKAIEEYLKNCLPCITLSYPIDYSQYSLKSWKTGWVGRYSDFMSIDFSAVYTAEGYNDIHANFEFSITYGHKTADLSKLLKQRTHAWVNF